MGSHGRCIFIYKRVGKRGLREIRASEHLPLAAFRNVLVGTKRGGKGLTGAFRMGGETHKSISKISRE